MKPHKFDQIFAILDFFAPLISIGGKWGAKLTEEKCCV